MIGKAEEATELGAAADNDDRGVTSSVVLRASAAVLLLLSVVWLVGARAARRRGAGMAGAKLEPAGRLGRQWRKYFIRLYLPGTSEAEESVAMAPGADPGSMTWASATELEAENDNVPESRE